MESSSPVSKFAANSTDTAWAQSYSAGRLYVVLSLEGEIEGVHLNSLGKETLEKLQREFFALDHKNLESLKKVTSEVAKTIPSEISLSLVVATTLDDILYIVTADAGFAILKRGQKTSVIAEGSKGEILGFSGRLYPHDTVLIGTEGLFSTIPPKDMGQSLHHRTSDDIAESLAPFLHEKGNGAEAGIAWKVHASSVQATIETEKNDEYLESHEKPQVEPFFTRVTSLISSVHIPKNINRKYLITIAVTVLVLFLVGSIFIDRASKKTNEQLKAAQNLISENQSKYDDAVALLAINKSLAENDLSKVKASIEEGLKAFPPNSPAHKKLQSFLNQVNQSLGGQGGNSKISLFFDASKNTDLKSISSITTKGADTIATIGDGKSGLISSSGTVNKTFGGQSNVKGVTADENNFFVLSGSKVLQISRDSLKSNSIIDSDKDPISVDTFGGNVYLLSYKDKTIYRYRPSSFSQESYLGSTKLSNPSSMAIDSSIYVLDDGKVRKFTRGSEDSFSTKNGTNFSNSSKIFTDINYANLYILDADKKEVFILDKTGNQVSDFSLKGLKNITSIATNEKDKKIYIVASGNIYSIGF